MIVGYTTGVFDLFHIGHLNLLRNAKSMCDKLIVGVSTDELVKETKHKMPLIPFDQRIEIVRSIEFVDLAISQTSMAKYQTWLKLKFNILFVGDDWLGHAKWVELENRLDFVGVKTIYLPYTRNVSSTMINKLLEEKRV